MQGRLGTRRKRQRTRRLGTAAAVGAVALIAIVAVAFSIERGDTPEIPGDSANARAENALVGPHTPRPGSLDGRLLVSRGDQCALHQIDLHAVRIDRGGSANGCDFWVSPDGDLAVTESVVAQTEGGSQRSLVSMHDEIAEIEDQPSSLRDPTRWQGSPAWGPDGDRLAICRPEGETVVLDLETDHVGTLAGCWPVFTPSGSVLTFDDRTFGTRSSDLVSIPTPSWAAGRPVLSTTHQTILEDGEERLALASVRAGLSGNAPSLGRILGFAASHDGRLAVTVLYVDGLELKSIVQFWKGGQLVQAAEIPLVLGRDVGVDPQRERSSALMHSLRFGPADRELAITLQGQVDEVLLIDSRTGNLLLGPLQHSAFDWSPGGTWLGVATSDQIDIYGPDRSSTPTFTLPVVTSALAWRAS